MAKLKSKFIIDLSENELFSEKKFLDDIDVELDNLQLEISQQGGRHWKYGKLHVLALREVSKAVSDLELREAELKQLKAELENDIRQDHANDDVRFTDKACDAEVRQSKKYLSAVAEIMDIKESLVDLQFTCNILSLAREIFSDRTGSLRTLGYMDRSQGNAEDLQVKSRREIDKLKARAADIIDQNRRRR